jgi:acyl-CoA thioester hydrolase
MLAAMPLSTHIEETLLRVRYTETDAAGIAHHSSYVNWMEVGRVEWLRALGSSYRDLESDGFSLPVVEMHLGFVAPARFDDALLIRTALADARSRTVTFIYEILSAEPHVRQLANGMTRHICLRHGLVAPLPESVRALVSRRDGA